MNERAYFFEPLSTLFFKGGEPFNAGEDHFIKSFFPPTPQSFQGIVRSKVLAEGCVDPTRYGKQKCKGCTKESDCPIPGKIGYGSKVGSVRIKGPFLGKIIDKKLEPYFPVPSHLLRAEEGFFSPTFIKPEDVLLDLQGELCLPYSKKTGSSPEGFLSWGTMKKLLWDKKMPKYDQIKTPWVVEERPGIERDSEKGISQPGKLYSAGHIRLEDNFGLWGQVEGTNLAEGLHIAGGEGRFIRIEEINHPNLDMSEEVAEMIIKEKHFSVILTKAVRFERGWLPDGFDPITFEGHIGNIRVRLFSAILKKPQSLGGFDIVTSSPKTMYKYVNPGTTFFLEIISKISPEVLQNLHNTPALGPEEERKIGFGHIMIGRY